MSSEEAVELAAAEFEEVLFAELVPELELRSGEEITDFLGKFAARVQDDAGGPAAVVESTLPLRAAEGGSPEPLDGDLEREGDHFEPDNPIVNTELPVQLERGISIAPANVEVVPETTPSTVTTRLDRNVFYSNTNTDTDVMAAPTATGVELFYQLRSSASPESHDLSLRLPPNAELTDAPEGGALIEREGEPLVSIGAPKAWDAAERPVEVRYELSGDKLEVLVSHRDRGYLYPIMVDPPFGYYNWSGGAYSTDHWTTYVTPGSPFSSFFSWDAGNNKLGVMNRAPNGRAYGQYQLGEWYAASFPDTYIERVDFYNFDQMDATDRPQMCTFEGIWGNGWWVNGTAWDAQTNQTYPAGWISVCGNRNFQTRSFWVGSNYYPDDHLGGSDAEAPDGSQGIFMLQALENGIPSTRSENIMRSANVWRYDRYAPTISGTPPTGWINDQQTPINFTMADRGLGLRKLQIRSGPSNQSPLVAETPEGCDGGHTWRCPYNRTLRAGLLPQGVSTLSAFAVDAGDTSSAPRTWTAKIDRDGPVVQSVSGSLWDQRSQVLEDDDYSLTVRAADGSSAAPRSGVKSISIAVDGEELHLAEQECPGGSCELLDTWTFPPSDVPPGNHVVRIVAEDQAGNQSAPFSFNITTGIPEQDEGNEDVPAEAIAEQAALTWPATYAGSWRNTDGTLSFAFTQNAQANVDQLSQSYPQPNMLRAVTVARSQQQLEALQQQMIADRRLANQGLLNVPGMPSHYDLGIDNRINKVYAVVEELTPLTITAFEARYGPDVVVRQGLLGVDEACTRANCGRDLRAGLLLTSDTIPCVDGPGNCRYICSSAFTVRHGAGERQLLSAGHCLGNGRFHPANKRVGTVAQEVDNDADVDAERIGVDGNINLEPTIWIRSRERARDVRRVSPTPEGVMLDTRVCKSGAKTGFRCGRVLDTAYSPDGTEDGGFIDTTYCAKGGDSGAAVFRQSTALGVHKGGSSGGCRREGSHSYFTHIDHVEQALGVAVVTR